MPTLTPAYGRDDKSAKAAKEAYLSGVDFILNDITSRWDGKPCSIRDMHQLGEPVFLRYKSLMNIVDVTNETKSYGA